MLPNALLPLVVTVLSVYATDPLGSHAERSCAYGEAPATAATNRSRYTDSLPKHTTLTQQYQRPQPALVSAAMDGLFTSNPDLRRNLHDIESEAQKVEEHDGNSAVDSGLGQGKYLSRKAESAECGCSGKVSGTYKTATIVLAVIMASEVLLALLWVCFGSLFMVLVGLYLG